MKNIIIKINKKNEDILNEEDHFWETWIRRYILKRKVTSPASFLSTTSYREQQPNADYGWIALFNEILKNTANRIEILGLFK